MSLGLTWGQWLQQPPEHKALYLQARETLRQMDAVDEDERAKE